MRNAIAHHLPTDAQLVPKQQSAPLPSLYTEHDIIWYGISLWPVGVSCPGCIPFQLLVPLQPSCLVYKQTKSLTWYKHYLAH